MTLDDLGPRLCIMGPSNSGKSTLALAIARARGLKPIHLDQLYHLPNTDWQPRPGEEFVALHDEAIQGERWVMDGNYSRCLPQRLERATGVILVDSAVATSLFRYLRRSWFERIRQGALEGGRDSVKWSMIRHIAVTRSANLGRYEEAMNEMGIPCVRLGSARHLSEFYCAEGLRRE